MPFGKIAKMVLLYWTKWLPKLKIEETRNVSVWHRCLCPGPSSPTCRHFAKNEVEKGTITLIINGRFYPKSNLTIFYDYKSMYKIRIQYTNQFFLKKYRKENIFWRWKRAVTPKIICLCWGFMAQSTKWGHVERGQFTLPHVYWAGLVLYMVNQYCAHSFHQKLTTALLESAERREWL